jgi:predicted ATP-dependent endonuclease of OLD family
MRLESFRVKNFRSVVDSGPIDVSDLTALLGRNESGKSNLLRGLQSLNSSDGFEAMRPIKDFPRHWRLEDCTDETELVWTRWRLDQRDQKELVEILPRAVGVTHLTIRRPYGKTRYVNFEALQPLTFEEKDVKPKVRKIVPAVKAAADTLQDAAKEALELAADAFESGMVIEVDKFKWAEKAKAAIAAVRKALAIAAEELGDKEDEFLDELQDLAESIANDKDAAQKARIWALDRLPVFIYVDEYSELQGHQNIAEYLSRKSQRQLTDADRNFEKLCKVSGLDPAELQELSAKGDHETRNQLANRAGSVVTAELRRLWRDRQLKVRFNLDAQFLDTLIADPTAVYDVEVNLNDRSRGLQWFFSFYIGFAADTKGGGSAENAILLLDEPGLYLHAKSQSDLLAHLEKDFPNQILFTTHSPFMVPTHQLESVRTVNISEESGTTVTNAPTGDSRTLFPLQAALGYNIAQSLFIGQKNLVVEGVTDFWVLSAVSEYLADKGLASLESDLTITPVGGAQKVQYMVALLTAEEQKVLVLLDYEKESEATRDELVKSKLIDERSVMFMTEAFGAAPPKEADLEDLLDPAVYEAVVRESYAKELTGKEMKPNENIPRVAKRMELALRKADVEFHKTRPTRLLLNKMKSDPASILTPESQGRFERLFKLINKKMARVAARKAPPFS